MMKTIDQLLLVKSNKTIGNHSVEFIRTHRNFYYHSTCIVEIYEVTKEYRIPDGRRSQSTFRAISSYRSSLDKLGYKEVE